MTFEIKTISRKFSDIIEDHFDMQHDLNKVVLITGKTYTEKTATLQIFIDKCIKIGGTVITVNKLNSIGKTIPDILDIVLPHINGVTLLAIDGTYDLTDNDIIKAKEFAKTHNCQIIITAPDKFCSEFVDGHMKTPTI